MKSICRHIVKAVALFAFTVGGTDSFAVIDWPGTPTPDGYPSDPAERIHHWKEEAIVGNQYMTVQLDANGTIYDIYYPSSGFRNGSGTSNEGYHGPEGFVGGACSGSPCFDCGSAEVGSRLEANGQMNVIAGMGGIQIGGNIYWMKNSTPPGVAAYDSFSQGYVPNNNVLVTSNRLNVSGNTMRIVQYDFCPSTNAIPAVATDGVRTNNGVYIKRYLITNLESSAKTIKFYFDVNFNVKGENAGDFMYMDYDYTVPALGAGQTNHTMVVVDGNDTVATGGGCAPNGYGDLGDSSKEYNPKQTASYDKYATVAFGVCMKEVTNAVTGAGIAFDGSWRDYTSTDHQEGWIGKTVNFAANETKEIDIMIVGSWRDAPNESGVHDQWGRPLVNWFYANDMAAVHNTTEAYWTDWLARGVSVDLPGTAYDTLFKRSLLTTALHIDAKTGSIIAGMHNGAYPFVWPRDGVYAAITLDRCGYTKEAENFYRWLRDIAFRWSDDCTPTGKSFFFQKYTTDGYFAWNSPQIDETASVPWGIWYHYLTTGDMGFLLSYTNLVRETAYSSYWTSCKDSRAHWDFTYSLMNGNNVWEDSFGLFIYSNSSVVRGLRDAANCFDKAGSGSGEAASWRGQANTAKSGIDARITSRVEPADISHLGMAVPYEVFTPADPQMDAVLEWIKGVAAAGGFNDNLEESGGGNAGYWRRYNHNIGGAIDNYWGGGPWHLSTAWYGEYHARRQDYFGGKSQVDVTKDMLDKIIARLGPVGLGAEQIAPDYAQKYPDFWHQAAWPNVWESHSTFLDLMMMFLDYKPAGTNDNTCYFAPKLPTGWSTMSFNNMFSQGQRFNITITESNVLTRADVNKLTAGSLNYDLWLRIPAGPTPVIVVTNGAYYVPSFADYDTITGRVHIRGPFTSGAGANSIIVTYGNADSDGDGMTDAYEISNNLNPLIATGTDGPSADVDGDGQSNYAEFLAGTSANNAASYLHVTSVAREGINVRVTWKAGGGTTNMLQFAPGSGGSYSNNFTDLAPQLVLPGSGDVTTNKVDSGGATNVPSRFYRIKLIP